jgi:Cd2+/Zn2+-exporting ATPase
MHNHEHHGHHEHCHEHHEHCHEHNEHCHEHHEHHHEGGGRRLVLIIAAALLLVGAIVVDKTLIANSQWSMVNGQWSMVLRLLIYLVPYLLVGYETLKEAAEGVARGQVFNEHFLMTIATVGAMTLGFLPGGEPEFAEAVFVMLFFQVGELFEGYAEGQSRRSIAHLMDVRPDTARVERDGRQVSVNPNDVALGETIVIGPGEKVALDGVVTEGSSQLNTVALTGESMPRPVGVGDEALSGCINMQGLLKVRVTKSFGESTASRIIAMVEDAAEHKSKSEAFITRFARIYTPIVVFAAIAIAIFPPLLSNGQLSIVNSQLSIVNGQWVEWLRRALMFLVVSCPCALVISVPLTFFGGIGGASRRGILVKGANYLDRLAKTDTVVFDKTGTLTLGQFVVTAVHPDRCDEHRLLHLAAHVEHYSTHPIGAALREAFPEEATDGCRLQKVEEVAGHGIRAEVEGETVSVGNTRMMDSVGAKWHECRECEDGHRGGTMIHVAIDGDYAGHIIINDKVKDDSAAAIRELKGLGVSRTVMLTGDRHDTADGVARELAIDEWHCELMPADKVAHVERLLASPTPDGTRDGMLAFVGDGINDAPVLALADVGIAMGGLGSDAAIEAADVVLMDDSPLKVATAIRIARRTLGIARQNVWGAIGVKAAVLVLALLGIASMWMAVFADVGVTVLAVLNAMRTLKRN